MKTRITLAFALMFGTILVLAQEKGTSSDGAERSAADLKVFSAATLPWQDASALPAGAQMAVLDGDPTKSGVFTARLKMPAGYKIPPHTHPFAERVTVISGSVYLGMGEKFDDRAGRELKPGDFTVIPAGAPHFAWSKGEAVLQLHAEGPFQRTFVDPTEDPASRKK